MQDHKSLPLFILIDGHSLAFRAYYAFAKARNGPLQTSTGIPTSVCFGFLNSLIQILVDQKPQYLAIAFDLKEPTFRHKVDANYKANRQETPENFICDLANLQELLKALNIAIVTCSGYEADDVLGTLANKGNQSGCQVKIISGDRDLFQLVDESKNISVLYLERRATKISYEGYTEFNSKAVEAKLGVKPTQVIDYKALCGDRSDSIPGVKGIGDKTAVKFLKTYSNLQEIYSHLDQIKGANNRRLREGMEDAEHSRNLAKIITDIPIEIDLKQCQLKKFNFSSLKTILQKLELNKFIKEIDQIKYIFEGKPELFDQEIDKKKSGCEPRQLSLFPSKKLVKSSNKLITKNDFNLSQIKPEIITDLDQLNNLVSRLKQYIGYQHFIAWDTETTSLEPRDAELVGIGCCWGHNITDIAYIPIGHTKGVQLKKKVVLEKLRLILENDQYAKVFQNTKFDRLVLHHQGIKLTGIVFDTMLASYVLHPEMSHNLSDLCYRYLSKISPKSYKELGIVKGETIASLDIEVVADYCGMDAYITYLLVDKLEVELESIKILKKLLIEVEQPLESVLAVMEDTGVRIDTNYLQELSKQLQQDLEFIEEQVYQEAGKKFNLGSPKQLGEVLFENLHLDYKKSRKTKLGYSTDHATLEKLQGDHSIIDYILEHRTLSKLKSTYVDALPALVRDDTQRIHTDFNQTVTATGRLSSSNPNLQNIPIRSQFSRKLRQAFIPEENWLLVSADYSQIELRILAHLSQESVLLEAYRNYQDVHTVTAKLLFNKETITPEERNIGKTINFGVIYGMGAQRFAREAGVTVAEGKIFIDKYRQRYARVFEFLEKTKTEAITKGFVTTILGRRRYFNFVTDRLQKLKGTNPQNINLNELHPNYTDAQLLRAAANTPIQGSSADIIKVTMIKIQEILSHYKANLLLQVHDELVFEVPPEEWDELQKKIKQTMENTVILTVPLVVNIYSGNNWMEAK